MEACVPVRLNLFGGWSDQDSWDRPAAVVNMAVGWKNYPDDNPYPLIIGPSGTTSKVNGVGTGLGISSILQAARYLLDNQGNVLGGDYIQHVLDWERLEGTCGGWQDQIGAIHPGFKLIQTSDHLTFSILNRDDHPILDHLVLFDTDIRRPSRLIGDQVRNLFSSRSFCQALAKNVDDAIDFFDTDNAEEFALACIAGWKRLVYFVPDMEINLPAFSEAWGHMLVGAGGGGWGLYFVKSPGDRQAIINRLSEKDMEAHIPILLDGIQFRGV